MVRNTPEQEEKIDLIYKLLENIDNLNKNDLKIIKELINKGYNDNVNLKPQTQNQSSNKFFW